MRTEPTARSTLPMPYVISDEMPPTEQVNGQFYTSKKAFRAVGKALGLTEVGNEKPKPKRPSTSDPSVKRARLESIRIGMARYRSGQRARPHDRD